MNSQRPIDHLFAQLDALRHLPPTHPLRQSALDAIWYFTHPDWIEVEVDCVIPF
jgi:hypothetical protein